jgi:hypothetical protein
LIYLGLIPISFFHYRHKNRKATPVISEEEEAEDVL